MRFRIAWQSVSALTLVTVSLLLIPCIQKEMDQIRESDNLTSIDPLENAPPLVSFTTIALGGFRGVLADFLFLRLQAMQERERFFEIVQLASWVVKLEPRFTAASTFLAWNMAYNVSVMFRDPADRWRWVQYGIELLRDQALVYSPGNTQIYKELGWIYQHKVGQPLDDAHSYYKTQLAKQVIRILGDKPTYDWRRLSATPKNKKELLQSLGNGASDFQRLLNEQDLTLAKMEFEFRTLAGFTLNIRDKLADLELLEVIEEYFRVRWLQADLKLDARLISELIDRYGPLDFRLPEAHAVYWATIGVKRSANGKNIDCERMIFQSLKNAFISGKLARLATSSLMLTTANIELADATKTAYISALKNHKYHKSIVAGYENFMVDAIVILYIYGKERKAAEYLHSIRESREFNNKNRYSRDLDEFVLFEITGDIETLAQDKALAIIQAFILQSYNSLTFDDNNRAIGFKLMAQKIYRYYMGTIQEDQDAIRRGLPQYNDIERQCRIQFMESYPSTNTERYNR